MQRPAGGSHRPQTGTCTDDGDARRIFHGQASGVRIRPRCRVVKVESDTHLYPCQWRRHCHLSHHQPRPLRGGKPNSALFLHQQENDCCCTIMRQNAFFAQLYSCSRFYARTSMCNTSGNVLEDASGTTRQAEICSQAARSPVCWARGAAASVAASADAFFLILKSTAAFRSSKARSGKPAGSAEGAMSFAASPDASPPTTILERTDDDSECLPLAFRNNHSIPLHLAS